MECKKLTLTCLTHRSVNPCTAAASACAPQLPAAGASSGTCSGGTAAPGGYASRAAAPSCTTCGSGSTSPGCSTVPLTLHTPVGCIMGSRVTSLRAVVIACSAYSTFVYT